jgi:hypothetical protein
MLEHDVVRADRTWSRAATAAVGAVGLVTVVVVVGPDLPGGVSVCPTHLLLGLDCPACGATRGLHSLLTGDVVGALSHNLLLAVVVPLGLLWWLAQVRQATGGPPVTMPSVSRRAWTWVIAGIAAFALVRNLSLPGLTWLDAA